MKAAIDRRKVNQIRGTHFRVNLSVLTKWSSNILGEFYGAVSVSLMHSHLTDTNCFVPYISQKVLS